MKLLWIEAAWKDYLGWHRLDPGVFHRINDLISNTQRTPFVGIGKPEPLKGAYSGCWSPRITAEHRLVYRVGGKGEDQHLEILSCRDHY